MFNSTLDEFESLLTILQHVISKQHRKFATTADNWAQLDDLLNQLVRPLKDDE
jgi:hypothetical protein